MDQLLIQRTRYVLRSRIRRIQTCPPALFVKCCVQFNNWLHNHVLLGGIAQHLLNVSGQHKELIEKIYNETIEFDGPYDPGFYTATSLTEHASICLLIFSSIVKLDTIETKKHDFTIRCYGEYLTNNPRITFEDALEALRDVAIDGLYEYLDEQLDTRNALYAILIKYKQRSEWFHRKRLRFAADEGLEGLKGERALALDLQEYVLNQGVEFVVEPTSASGEVDLILRDSDGRYIIIDAKYLQEEVTYNNIRTTVAKGFSQVSRYCNDYNEPVGFLVVFVRTATKIRFELEESDNFRFIHIGGKKIFYLSVEIADLPSASKSGIAEEAYISKKKLINSIEGSFD